MASEVRRLLKHRGDIRTLGVDDHLCIGSRGEIESEVSKAVGSNPAYSCSLLSPP